MGRPTKAQQQREEARLQNAALQEALAARILAATAAGKDGLAIRLTAEYRGLQKQLEKERAENTSADSRNADRAQRAQEREANKRAAQDDRLRLRQAARVPFVYSRPTPIPVSAPAPTMSPDNGDTSDGTACPPLPQRLLQPLQPPQPSAILADECEARDPETARIVKETLGGPISVPVPIPKWDQPDEAFLAKVRERQRKNQEANAGVADYNLDDSRVCSVDSLREPNQLDGYWEIDSPEVRKRKLEGEERYGFNW